MRVGLALSGGGSRAIAFHYGVLETFHELGIDKKINVLSGISGGAVVAALWNLFSQDWTLFSRKIEWILDNGFEKSLGRRLLALNRICDFLKLGINPDHLSAIFDEHLFDGIKLTDIPSTPFLILNATELKEGVNFKFSKEICGSYKDGGCQSGDLRLSQAVAYSASFTAFFSVKKFMMPNGKKVFLTDGGAYDCLGANALMPGKGASSILAQNCESLIFSDASFPFQKNRKNMDFSIANGLYGAYLTSSNRNRSLIYQQLFLLNQQGLIPHLGVIKMDSSHPDHTQGWSENELDFINKYKTDFKPVVGEGRALLKKRAKLMTEFTVKTYLKHLL